MPISGLLWTLKNSIINRFSHWLLLCSYTMTSLSQMFWASLYINTKSTTGWLSTLVINTAIWALSRFHTNKKPFNVFSVFVILGHFCDPSIIDIISYCSKCIFLCHSHLAHLGAPTSFSTFISEFNTIFSLVCNIQLHTMKWIQNTS